MESDNAIQLVMACNILHKVILLNKHEFEQGGF